MDVRGTDTLLEHGHRAPVLVLQPHEPARLNPEHLRQPLEPGLLGGELALEAIERGLRLVDGRLGSAELRRDLGELRRQHALLLLGGVDLRLELRDALVDARLLGRRVFLTRSRRRHSEREREDGDEQ